eukprot:4751760-Pleurochrysis_carterae.AAC.8
MPSAHMAEITYVYRRSDPHIAAIFQAGRTMHASFAAVLWPCLCFSGLENEAAHGILQWLNDAVVHRCLCMLQAGAPFLLKQMHKVYFGQQPASKEEQSASVKQRSKVEIEFQSDSL